jgi:phage terminase large subunit-like protein
VRGPTARRRTPTAPRLELGPPPEGCESWAVWLALQPEAQREKFVRSLSVEEAQQLSYNWSFFARPKQLAPPGDWRVWLLLSGRGFGKTRTINEWLRDRVERGIARRIHIVARTVKDVHNVVLEGESGLLTVSPPWFRPRYIAHRCLLVWPNEAQALVVTAETPDALRGPQCDTGVADELAAWQYPDAWNQLMLGLRIGKNPQVAVATTPRPTDLIRSLLSDPNVSVTRGSSYENRGNLSEAYFEQVIKQYEGTRLGRQEIDAEVLDDNPGALWKRTIIDALREKQNAREIAKDCKCIVVSVDPSVSTAESANECGIVVFGLGRNGHGYVLEDCSGKFSPAEWARVAVWKYTEWQANAIVAETNQGGQLVVDTLRGVTGREGSHNKARPIWAVHASRGKKARAEPVAALYEQGRIHHCGTFPKLEDQLCSWDPIESTTSPDRLDALVWGATRLMLGETAPKRGPLPPDLARKLF